MSVFLFVVFVRFLSLTAGSGALWGGGGGCSVFAASVHHIVASWSSKLPIERCLWS